MVWIAWLIATNVLWATLYLYEARRNAKDKKQLIAGYTFMIARMKADFHKQISSIKNEIKQLTDKIDE